MCGLSFSPVSAEMSGKHLAVAAKEPDIDGGSCGLVACRQKVITVSYTSALALSLSLSHSPPDQTLTPQGVIDTH